MPSYSNGYIPDNLLVTFHTGYTPGEGAWKHQLSPSTYAKHLALVALAKHNTGRTLEITDGWGAYRPYDSQVYARSLYGMGAAYPGTSSHGGFWEGQQTMAMDYGNWAWVFNGNRDDFYWAVREVGLTPGMIHPSRGNGYPDEPWHVVDVDNIWATPASAGGNNSQSEEDDMTPEQSRKLDAVAEQASAVYAAIFGARNLTGKETPISWVNFKGDAQSTNYGVLPILLHNQTLIASQVARITELEKTLSEKSA